jgi:hypothetical protein
VRERRQPAARLQASRAHETAVKRALGPCPPRRRRARRGRVAWWWGAPSGQCLRSWACA